MGWASHLDDNVGQVGIGPLATHGRAEGDAGETTRRCTSPASGGGWPSRRRVGATISEQLFLAETVAFAWIHVRSCWSLLPGVAGVAGLDRQQLLSTVLAASRLMSSALGCFQNNGFAVLEFMPSWACTPPCMAIDRGKRAFTKSSEYMASELSPFRLRNIRLLASQVYFQEKRKRFFFSVCVHTAAKRLTIQSISYRQWTDRIGR